MDRKNIVLGLALILGSLFYGYYVSRFGNAREPLVGRPAPFFQVETFEGGTLKLQDLIGKKYVLVNFWATWCAPCQEEMPEIVSLYHSVDAERLMLVSLLEDDEVDAKTNKKNLDRFTKKIPIPFPVYTDKNQIVADLYGTYKIPESYLIDLKGNVVRHIQGALGTREREEIIKIVSAGGARLHN